MSETRASAIRADIETREGYDAWAATYDRIDNPLIAMTAIAMRAWRPRLEGQRVLELGCGTGRNARFFLEAGCAEYVGLDASGGMLAQARARAARGELDAARVRFVEADAREALPEAARGVDLVFLSLVLEHVQDVRDVLRVAAEAASRGEASEQGVKAERRTALRILELHPRLREAGTQAHFRDGDRELYLPSYAHDAEEYRAALAEHGWDLESIADWYATDDAIDASAKLARYRGQAVLVEVSARRRR